MSTLFFSDNFAPTPLDSHIGENPSIKIVDSLDKTE